MIYVVNRSGLVSNADVATMTNAVDQQMHDHVEPAWNLPRLPVLYATTPPVGAKVVLVVDTADDPQALGYHTETKTIQSGIVGCKPELDNGAHPLTGPYSVASILSHEVLELAVDGACNLWADSGKGYLVAYEVGDPVQSDCYTLAGCSVSNFVLPAWFDPQTRRGSRVDQMGKLATPFTLSKGGYWVMMRDGVVTQRFGEQMPEWLIAAKAQNPTSRTRRRDRA
jgi:hypothetical protein